MIWIEVGQRIQDIRSGKSLTQAQFGKLFGVSRQVIGNIERGQKLSVELVADICKKTGVTADYILFGSDLLLSDFPLLSDFSAEQIEIGFDIIKEIAKLIRTKNCNELLIKELMRRYQTIGTYM